MACIVGIEVTVTIHDAVLPAIDHALSPFCRTANANRCRPAMGARALSLAALSQLARAKRLVNVGQDGGQVVHLLGAMHHQLL